MDFKDLLNRQNQNRKAELQAKIEFYKKQSNRSRNCFFINILGMLFTSAAAYFFIPTLIGTFFEATKWTVKKAEENKLGGMLVWTTSEAKKAFRNDLRIKTLYTINTALILIIFLIGLGWIIFRFRKWTEYSHRVKVLQAELDSLEK